MPVAVNIDLAKLSHFRVDPLTGRRVIIAPGRGLRLSKKIPASAFPLNLPPQDPTCPFCPGNEELTPPELARISLDGQNRWDARCFDNKFPNLQLEAGNGHEREKHPLFLRHHIHPGVGAHELIVESCRHNACLSSISKEEIAAVLSLLTRRYQDLRIIDGINYFSAFKNYGPLAAASQDHPHWQLEVRAFAPWLLYHKIKKFAEFTAEQGICPLCLIMQERIIDQTDNFLACVPFAPFDTYEVIIAPKEHISNFAYQFGKTNLALEFAGLLRKTMVQIKRVIQRPVLGDDWARHSDPPYNIWLDTAPYNQEAGTFHWHLIIRPITTDDGGHEKGTGEKIIPAFPEEVANILRNGGAY